VYFFKVQGYQYPKQKDSVTMPTDSRYELILKAYIEVYETPYQTPIATADSKLIGMLARSEKQATKPTFVKVSDPSFHASKAEFLGDEGFNQAKVQLANFSHNALVEGIYNCFLDGGIERDFIFELCWFNVYTRRYFSVDHLELRLKQAPQEFTHDRAIYTLARTELLDSGATHCIYTLREGKSSNIEREFVLRTYKRNNGGLQRWLPVNELRMQLVKAPPCFTDQGIRYKLEGKTIELEDGTIYANYIPVSEDNISGGLTNGIL
jgi:hypothetical protein